MNILQQQPPITYSSNQCKKQFLSHEINSMKKTKKNYKQILQQLKNLIKQTHLLVEGKIQANFENQNLNKNENLSQLAQRQQFHSTANSTIIKHYNCNEKFKRRQFFQVLINSIKKKSQQNDCNIMSQKILKYLQIEKQNTKFFQQSIIFYKEYIKRTEKLINHREKQLRQIQILKIPNIQKQKQEIVNLNSINKILPSSVHKQAIQKNISTFDFNHKLLEHVKNNMVMLRLKKRKLEKQIQQNRKIQQFKLNQINQENEIQQLNQLKTTRMISYNGKGIAKLLLNMPNTTRAFTQQSTAQSQNIKNYNLKNSFHLKSEAKKMILNSKNQLSTYQKIVMIYQKQKLINSQLEQKINIIAKRIDNKKKINTLLKQKTCLIQSEIQKIDWNMACDESLFVSLDKAKQCQKQNNEVFEDLSILDRTNLNSCNDQSISYSQMQINQSLIQWR